jgi:hypothetical protein
MQPPTAVSLRLQSWTNQHGLGPLPQFASLPERDWLSAGGHHMEWRLPRCSQKSIHPSDLIRKGRANPEEREKRLLGFVFEVITFRRGLGLQHSFGDQNVLATATVSGFSTFGSADKEPLSHLNQTGTWASKLLPDELPEAKNPGSVSIDSSMLS